MSERSERIIDTVRSLVHRPSSIEINGKAMVQQ